MREHIEANGITDLIAQIDLVVQYEGVIDYSTVGGTGGNFNTVTFTNSVGEVVESNTREDLVQNIYDSYNDLKLISPVDVMATGGRNKYYWFDVEFPEPKEEPPENKEPKIDDEKDSKPEIKASAAAEEFARVHEIDLQKIAPTGKDGSITKKDVVNYKDTH